MAWRIHNSVVRGEIDNRERGAVRGKVWVRGISEPILLELRGNACADLAGCVLTFENPGESIPLPTDAHFAPVQRGTIGDLTASRKVRVFDIPFEEAYSRLKKKLPVPEHMANCLYLEWYSAENGRVVIESSDYKLKVSSPNWRLTREEEEQRQDASSAGFMGFVDKLSEALEAKRHDTPEDKEWDEFDYEKFMQECDARTDKYGELLDKYIDHPDRDRIIAKEMGWTWLEEALAAEKDNNKEDSITEDDPADPIAAETDQQHNREPVEFPDEIPDLVPDPTTEGVDWVRREDGHISHPLSLRAFEGASAFWHKCDKLEPSTRDDDDVSNLISEYQITGAKLAGALDGLAYGRDLSEGAFLVAYLKRALHHLHAAQAALEKVTSRKLLPDDLIASTRTELFQLREEILRLTNEFRQK